MDPYISLIIFLNFFKSFILRQEAAYIAVFKCAFNSEGHSLFDIIKFIFSLRLSNIRCNISYTIISSSSFKILSIFSLDEFRSLRFKYLISSSFKRLILFFFSFVFCSHDTIDNSNKCFRVGSSLIVEQPIPILFKHFFYKYK